jgi:hypothetical protein
VLNKNGRNVKKAVTERHVVLREDVHELPARKTVKSFWQIPRNEKH